MSPAVFDWTTDTEFVTEMFAVSTFCLYSHFCSQFYRFSNTEESRQMHSLILVRYKNVLTYLLTYYLPIIFFNLRNNFY